MASFADVETKVVVLKVKDTKVYKAAVEVKLKVDASAIVEARNIMGSGKKDTDLPGVKWCSFDKFLAAAVRAMAAARARGDDHRLFSAETLAAALISDRGVANQASHSIWPFLALLVGQDKKSREDAHAVWSKLVDAGLDAGKSAPRHRADTASRA